MLGNRVGTRRQDTGNFPIVIKSQAMFVTILY